MKPKSFAKLFEEAKKRDTYWVANAIYTFTEELHNMTEKKKITRTELARRMEVSPAYITKIFRGDVNFTIGTMVRLARRVGARLHLNLVQEGIEAYRSDWNFAYILPLKIYVFFENRRSRHKVQNHTKYWQDVKAEGALFSTMNEAEWKAEWQMLREKQQLPSSYQMP